MKNLLTQWDTEEKNQKIYKMWLVKKPPNLIGYKGGKPGGVEQKKGLKLLCLLGGNSGGLNKLTIFLC